MKIIIPSWSRHQHYKERNPPWIKLHKELLDDPEYWALSDFEARVLIAIWLLASCSTVGGEVHMDGKDIAWRLRLNKSPETMSNVLKNLEKHGFIKVDSEALAPGKQDDIPETEEEKRQRERREAEERKKAEEEARVSKLIADVVLELNTVTGSSFEAGAESTAKHIRARINDKRTLDDFKAVIRDKQAEWGNDSKMRKFLRPETLFGNKFDGYLSEARRARVTPTIPGAVDWDAEAKALEGRKLQ